VKNKQQGGTSMFFVLFLIFLVLKLEKIGSIADWSWWWVTSPLWIGFIFYFIVFTIAYISKK
jgi:small Trp-rich protein